MRFFRSCGGALSPMAQNATELGETMRHRRVWPERLRLNVEETRLFERDVTCRTAVEPPVPAARSAASHLESDGSASSHRRARESTAGTVSDTQAIHGSSPS